MTSMIYDDDKNNNNNSGCMIYNIIIIKKGKLLVSGKFYEYDDNMIT